MNRILLFVLILITVFPVILFAADVEPQLDTAQPIEVTARQLDADQQQRQATFTGDVVARQGDITLYCDKLVVYALPKQDQVDRLEAIGRVRVVQLDRTATADRAVYRKGEETLSLYGNAKVHQGQNEVTGSEIIVYLQEDRSLVKGSENDRVRAIFFPKQSQQRKQE